MPSRLDITVLENRADCLAKSRTYLMGGSGKDSFDWRPCLFFGAYRFNAGGRGKSGKRMYHNGNFSAVFAFSETLYK